MKNRFAALLAGTLMLAPHLALAGASPAPGTGVAQDHGEADLVLRNGTVITLDEDGSMAQAVAVRDGHIVAVGKNAQIASWIGGATQVIDLHGQTLVPGFIDAHAHVQGLAASEYIRVPIQAPPLADADAILAKLRERQRELPPGSWLIGQGTYNQVMPTRAQLDAAFPDNPVQLRWSAHDSLINHKAALAAGLTADAPDPVGVGRYERGPDGEVWILRDAPVNLHQPEPTYAQQKKAIARTLTDFFLDKGVTTVFDMSSPEIAFRAYQELKQEGALPVRLLMGFMIGNHDGEQEAKSDGHELTTGGGEDGLFDALLKTGLHTGFGDDWLTVGPIKIFLDGVWGTTAATYKPAWKGSGTTWVPDNTGGVSRSQDTLNHQFLLAQQNDWTVWVHANGDRAQDMVLNAVEYAQAHAPQPDPRHRIEHMGHFLVEDPARTPERLARMKRDGVIPSIQVAMLWRLTQTNAKEPDVTFFAERTMIDHGFHPPLGSDTLGTQNYATNPLFSIDRAVNRTTKFGQVVQPEQAVTPLEALKMATIWAAWSGHLEKSRGSIEVGKLADFAVLDHNPLTIEKKKIGTIAVTETIVGGKLAYQRP